MIIHVFKGIGIPIYMHYLNITSTHDISDILERNSNRFQSSEMATARK